ncbi:MAG: hypothetical protein MUE66_03845 [Acidimicrobiia bacterium]|jgi:hypothetical protein|nr:hypothetical protein [Acidimicrobiia bacterium]
MPPEQAEGLPRRHLVASFSLLGVALAAAAVATVAGVWLTLGGVEPGTALHRGLSRGAGGGAIAAGVLCLAWAVYTSRRGLWPTLPAWVRPLVGGALVVVLAVSFLVGA